MERKRKTPAGPELVVTSVRIEKETWHRFCEVAAESHRTASQEMRRLIEERIEVEPEEAAA